MTSNPPDDEDERFEDTCKLVKGCPDETFAIVSDPLSDSFVTACARHTVQAAVVYAGMGQAAEEALLRIFPPEESDPRVRGQVDAAGWVRINTNDPAATEQLARAFFVAQFPGSASSWDKGTVPKEPMLRYMRAALAAVQGEQQ